HRPYAIGLWGDMPYSTEQATVGMPNLIADINSQKLAFTVNDGDLKAGSGDCSDAVYAQAQLFFSALQAPAAFTPGDNDWTGRPHHPPLTPAGGRDHRALFFSPAPFPRGPPRPPRGGAAGPAGQPPRGGGAVRRKPPLARRRRDLRHVQRPGLVQQPVRHRPR